MCPYWTHPKEVSTTKLSLPQETKSARVVSVIETITLAGSGTDEDPLYEIHQYWSLTGKLLAKSAPVTPDGVAAACPGQS